MLTRREGNTILELDPSDNDDTDADEPDDVIDVAEEVESDTLDETELRRPLSITSSETLRMYPPSGTEISVEGAGDEEEEEEEEEDAAVGPNVGLE